MNIQNYKFIVASGCSYGTTLSSLEKPLLNVELETDENLIFIEVNCASQGSDWMYDSTLYTIEKLLNIGVNPQNIYCFVEWTQIERITVTQPTILHEFFNTNSWKEKLNKHFYIHTNVKDDESTREFLYDLLDIKCLQDVHNVMSIEKLWYLNPTHIDRRDVLKFDNIDFEVSYNQMLEYELRVPIETRVKRYINNILNLQNYLNNLDIKYNFVCMQSQFSAWDINSDYNHIHKYTIRRNNPVTIHNDVLHINQNFKKNLNITKSDDLIEVFPQFKYLINQIDFSKWWFHKSDFFRYGGFDEYTIEVYGLHGYLSTNYDLKTVHKINIENIIPTFGYHPHAFIHVLLANDMMFNNTFFKVKNECIDRIKNMVEEDIESKNRTKHNLAISKTEIEKYISDIPLI